MNVLALLDSEIALIEKEREHLDCKSKGYCPLIVLAETTGGGMNDILTARLHLTKTRCPSFPFASCKLVWSVTPARH